MSMTLLSEASEPTDRKRWTRADCDLMERFELLTDRYELIDGEVIVKVGQGKRHTMAMARLLAYIFSVFKPERVQTQATTEVEQEDREFNRPEPDVAILGRPDYEIEGIASGEDIVLVVEVSDSSLRRDTVTKAALYARAGIGEYWVIDVVARRLIVFRQPENGVYKDVDTLHPHESVSPLASPDSPVQVSDLLPPIAETS